MADIGTESGERLYSLVRKKQPKVVVETGVANGFSTAVILSALEKNGSGKLISIDFPFKEDSESGITSVADGNGDEILDQFDAQTEKQIVLPSHKQPGWIVPEELRDNWELRLGRSQTLLPQLFCEEREVDLFIHDSDHRVPCQMFEYELSWEHLSGDGVLLSHDIHQPWEQFAEVRNHSKKGRLFPGFGYLAA